MNTINDLANKYRSLSDKELYLINLQISNYTQEANQALEIVLDERGGKKVFLNQIYAELAKEREVKEIEAFVSYHLRKGYPKEEILKHITLKTVDPAQVDMIIQTHLTEIVNEKENLRISPEIILKGIPATILGGILGGGILSLTLHRNGIVFLIFILGTGLAVYGTFKLFTRKDNQNIAVMIFTFLGLILSVFVAGLIYTYIPRP